MKNLINIRKIKFFLRDYWSTILTLVSIVVIILLVSSSYKSFKELSNQQAILKEEVNLLKNRSDTLKFNKSLTEDQIIIYNKILTSLIPESEDYFSVIYALETISQKTGFSITSYTINLSKSSREKMSIIIEGRGSLSAFLIFLRNYEYTGGRLITSEKIEFSGVNFTNTKVSLNFYSKKFTFNESVIPQLSKKDIEKLEQIKQKVQITLKEDESDTPQEYETKDNPF
ncbi:hypothetical protein A2334_05470 [Candidatus Roizmanbacteria bacterium RIFOXYB2_FULL_38_10]|uniref:Uncharacterized protein n=1 Tax=Candidatus Roizmanbacteria bacterium RIFOXYD1_FULL_38_12 TaxID=1802093 RepID=A0A1F7L0N0_9BACT|nr:MAG: hypothetical protein A3K47_02590 [Candidatus Roizmanbacteria bacterium RIFOXYA2_FULL_38_14]OGK63656.1 MAG: hypothetical protein A3K27_02590 [Candidatus Roizmanbacteria bacterium RIFOXYA1_FULL_37_12]OGK65502.1 MAG: hypothetical protein A3K38_02590 [Candidatus Roizmanbacteria bacterium RIFOXYB1_FULL_40_23]OGK68286.1 MAG: hypothetical protein A2334_05470 [Candidatus Roizmanbacteria bacterium RIFOXYB2_FULL_38_10]OGK69907.1 MAG: hypothetical protein A3K21_02595 [Candidatus Roizmanbacteria ba